jgi:hypothetical protein
MKNTLFLKKINAASVFFEIVTPLFFYFFAAAFYLLITTAAHAMRKTTESKISLSSSKNLALSVFTMGHCINYNTLKTS